MEVEFVIEEQEIKLVNLMKFLAYFRKKNMSASL